MKLQKAFACFCLVLLVCTISINTYASGKQIRPPQVDMCEIDPDSEGCSEESDNKTEENK